MSLVCVSNVMDDEPRFTRPHPCRVEGEHSSTCLDGTCDGCLPRMADKGMLCFHCWEKALDALNHVRDMIPHLRSIDTNGQAIGERVSSSMTFRMPVPDSWLVADDLMVALGAQVIPSTASIDEVFALTDNALNGWADPQKRVTTFEGAREAVRLTLVMQTALARWPGSEPTRPLPPILDRCPKCELRTLYRHAPIEYLGDIKVKCSLSLCGAEFDWFEFIHEKEHLAGAVVAAQKKAEKERKRA